MAELTSYPGIDAVFFSKPSNTSANVIYTVPSSISSAKLMGLNIAVNGVANITVQVNNGTTDYEVMWTQAFGANTRQDTDFGGVVLQSGWSLKVTTSSANNASFTATMREFIR